MCHLSLEHDNPFVLWISLRKKVLLGILLYMISFVLIYHISYQKSFVFSVYAFCSQIFTLIQPKFGLVYIKISTVKCLLEILFKKFFFFLTFLC